MAELRVIRWAIEWRSKNRLDGERRHFIWAPLGPVLFDTRQRARGYVEDIYGYIRERPDLRAEPHGWRMPRAVRVEVILKALRRG